MLDLLVVALAAALNRARGDARWMPGWLPGRALWYVAAAFALTALLAVPPVEAAAWGLAYLAWGLGPWGRWYDLGRLPEGYARPDGPGLFERAIEAISGGSDHCALFWRHMAMLPGFVLVAVASGNLLLPFLAPFAAAIIVGIYEGAWRDHDHGWLDQPIRLAEILTGALWGALILMA